MAVQMEPSMKDTLFNCLTQQIGEFELLKSMYPKHDDIIVSDDKIFDEIQNFLENKSEYSPSHLDFTVNLLIEGLKLEICINLPSFYPTEEPDIYVRCNQLNRQQETWLNTELSNQIKNNYLGEVCLYTAISWLQQNVDVFVSNTINKKPETDAKEAHSENDKFVRLWIYSHHIYNKKKREEIKKIAKEMNLTGFCVPGKPGVICVEGLSGDCEEWWKFIKSMNWKKIALRKCEEFDLSEQSENQKFIKFEEVHFPCAKHIKHMEKFMSERGLIQVFNDIFGLGSDN